MVPLSIAARRWAAGGRTRRSSLEARPEPAKGCALAGDEPFRITVGARASSGTRPARSVGDERRRRVGHRFAARPPRDTRQHERERPAERAGERAVGRRPVAHHHARRRRTAPHELGHRRARACPRPAGARPAAVATAAASAPVPGTTPPWIGYVGSRLVATKQRAVRAPRRPRASSPSKSKSRLKPDHHRVGVGRVVDHAAARALRAPRPRPAPRTRAPCRPRARRPRRARPPPARSCTRRRARRGSRTRASRST